MGGIIHREEFYAIKCKKDKIILGLPWLNHINPTINWVNKHVDIHEATDQTEEYNLATATKHFTIRKATQEPPTHPKLLPWEHEKEEPIYPDENFVNYVRGAQYVYTKATNRFQMIIGKLRPLTIAKTSIASKLAQQTKETPVTLLEEYAEYAEVFSEEASQKMPPSRPYDHPILLDETFVPKIGKVYPLSPDEKKATDNFIKENLKTGKIRPSSSPQASSFFYVKKRIPASDHAKITDMSMNTPSRMHIHYPSSPTSLIWSKMPPSLQSLISNPDIITSGSRKETNGRPPSLHPKDYLNQLSCSSDYQTPPPPSRDS